nr:hybrid sensor histidine kinase/response regulator transcription factor [Bacteroides reticulotermitis]
MGGGLNLTLPDGDKYVFRRFLTHSVDAKNIRCIMGDEKGYMWVGTSDGLYVFHPDTLIARPHRYFHYSYGNRKLLANQVKYVMRDSKGQVWVGTQGGGLSYCKPNQGYGNLSFTHFTKGDGLVDDVVQSIAEDDEGRLWIATEYGISRFLPVTRTFENFFFSNAVQGNVYSESTVAKLSDGRLLFGTNYGMVIIDPEKIVSPQTITHVVLTNFKVNGVSMHPGEGDSPLMHALAYTDKIELMHYQNSFVVEFSTFDYSVANGSQYTYKLEPFDTDWSEPSSLNFAVYKKMAPGTYRLHVKACNSAGIWSETETILEITIKPPFWRSSIAYMLYFVIICTVLYVTFRIVRKFNTLRNRIEVEKQLTDYKLMFFTNISHEFRTPLTLIRGALEKIEDLGPVSEEMTYPVRLMHKSTERMLRLINQLLEFRKMQSNKLTLMPEQTDVIPFLREIWLSFEETAGDKRISYAFEPSEPHYQMYVDREKLDKIVYNLLSNACKYTPDGGSITFAVNVEEADHQLVFSVSDTGIGIPKEKQRELFSRFMQSSFSHDSMGVGLHLTYELVNVHGGRITYKERKGGGSVFTVSLPLEQVQFPEQQTAVSPLGNRSALGENLNASQGSDVRTETPVPLQQLPSVNRRKILIIEDDSDVSRFLVTELDPYFEVTTAFDGLSGLQSAQTFDGDLIICDVLMPGMNGFDVTRRLKSNFDTSHIPIILLTAMSTAENQLEGTKSGADAYITKPFSPKLLLARVSQLIDQRDKLREKYTKDPTLINPILSTAELDQKFADKLKSVMEQHLENPDFSIDDFSTELKMGRTAFYRKVKGVTGYTPNDYMRIFRMKKAVELLQDGHYNVSEITYKVGMKDPHYFSRYFKELFGVSPSTYLRGDKEPTKE